MCILNCLTPLPYVLILSHLMLSYCQRMWATLLCLLKMKNCSGACMYWNFSLHQIYRRIGRLKKWKGLFSAYDMHLSICWHLEISTSSPFMRASHFLSNKSFCKHGSVLCVMSSEHWQAFTSIWAIFVWHWMLTSGHRLLRVTCMNSSLASVEPAYLVTAELLSEMVSEFEPVGPWQIVGESEQQTDPLCRFILLCKIEIIGGTYFACMFWLCEAFALTVIFTGQSPCVGKWELWVGMLMS